ncbi:AraC family transcriptional regulator [Flavobacterium rivuli WB 3.3-2 = DSM 21788]|uniref:AraC family transcriptional regulator n=1 Tax=Flavobacterium rivuli WB 3.3-2 = DSM 21788 TaxID=1121895 RepID=A0A0A2LY16_9FLAO|nr:helix-turn-helix transcriptional regulator [Flavobacterium rivuli]KGO84899.1 AraC family transcriptional regulator [Flavobacterium rivuli WB 3.3-2 = DSM 21788]
MKPESKQPYIFNSVSELHKALGLPKPLHPLISLVDYSDITADTTDVAKGMVLNFYKVSYKKNFKGKIKYGQSHYDFDEGGMSYISPNQIITAGSDDADYGGYTLLFHPDFLHNYALAQGIKKYGFFSYALSEALYLSDKEKEIITAIFTTIAHELTQSIDHFSQDIMISQIEQLLNYSNRFYNRQFITRRTPNNNLVAKMEKVLAGYFDTQETLVTGVPTVQFIADELTVTPRYLSDMLRVHTGQNAQQHIQAGIINKAKELLSTTSLSVGEIAYQLGFEHPQSFNKIFKKKMNVSPVEYRQSFY